MSTFDALPTGESRSTGYRGWGYGPGSVKSTGLESERPKATRIDSIGAKKETFGTRGLSNAGTRTGGFGTKDFTTGGYGSSKAATKKQIEAAVADAHIEESAITEGKRY